MEGRVLSHYRVLARLGGGGMGVVYKAEDTRLKRTVALKFLPPDLTRNEDARQRFIQEAQAASALDHPNICTVYEIDTSPDDQIFIAMTYYDGETLKQRIERDGPLPIAEALDLAIQIAKGLSNAHATGIVHRDIKPANVIVTQDGLAKILDFGIAKLLGNTGITQTGTTPGTVAYMSPEQIAGQAIDQRTDIWSLGVVLYEMLTGEAPFQGDTVALMNAILHAIPTSPRSPHAQIPVSLERVVMKALEKDRHARYASVAELRDDLIRCLDATGAPAAADSSLRLPRFAIRRRPVATASVLIALAVIAATVTWTRNRGADGRRIRQQVIPEIVRLTRENNYVAAFALAGQAERSIPGDPVLSELWPQISRAFSITTTPADATVSYAPALSAAGAVSWTRLGASPLAAVRLPRGAFYLRAEKPEFDPVHTLISGSVARADLALDPTGSIPARMVRIPGGQLNIGLAGFDDYPRVTAPSYLIDKYEVTNREYKAFLDAGGYRNRAYWQHEFVRDGQGLAWEDAVALLRDKTGRPGPSTWEAGTYPPGQDDHPVSGVSWYEAAAYATFAGRSLPSVYHWLGGTATTLATYVIPQSNFGTRGLMRVGSFMAGPRGTHDMAGNVKEWCWNQTRENRYILGAAWNDPTYLFFEHDERSPFDRSATNGFRTVDYLKADPKQLQPSMEAIVRVARNYAEEVPVGDVGFRTYADQFNYDAAPLNPRVEARDERPAYWRKELVSFDASYLGERIPAHLFLPKNVAPPYQAVIYYPGSSTIRQPSSDTLSEEQIDFIVKSGRAVLWPVYKDSFERRTGLQFTDPNPTRAYAEHLVWWVKDVRRSLDYLATRSDIAANKVAFFGFSWGARIGSIVLAVEPRLRTGVLQSGGFPLMQSRPEVREINFAPRVKVPVLMVNGRHDNAFPLEASQKPMFRLLGTPAEHKKHLLYDTGHGLLAEMRGPVVADILAWLDTYLGAVD